MKIQYFHFFRNDSYESLLFTKRIFIASAIITLLSSILIINLYYLQIINFNDYNNKAHNNYIKKIPIAPSRGLIYDRNGTMLALNKISYQLEITPEKVHNLQKTINDLKYIIDLTEEDITNFNKQCKKLSNSTVLILKSKLTEIQLAKFAVNKYRFTGVEIKCYQHRYYPYGSTLTHVLGYVSKINHQDKKKLNKEGILKNYIATKNIGKLGIEHYYEKILHGKTGYKKVEVNNHGQIIRELYEKPPQPGTDLILTLDLNLQQYIEKLLINNKACVIVLDPRDGSIRALISNPSYDPNLFVHGISNTHYNNLLKNKNYPLINRSIQGLYPPASTVKPYILLSALTLGAINKNFSFFDPGWWQLPGSKKYYKDWKKTGHGQLNVTNALEESADTFFYQIAYNMGIDKLSEWMSQFGYGQHSGIDISEEITGIMPTRIWKMKKFKQPWYQGDTISVGIGQGYWTATPIQMSKALITLINNGAVKTPHLFNNSLGENPIHYQQIETKQIGDPNADYWKIVKNGMFGAAHHVNGTVYRNFVTSTYKAAAKSGTAQLYNLKIHEQYNPLKIAQHLRDHKLMTAFAPYDNPKIALVIILEHGGNGGLTAGEITRSIFDYMLLNKDSKEYLLQK
ncbi:peptidoglycan DD-transpeptidase MrdA [Blochmannia endosymbiont of Camponotus (Colobopsis) obliquus]|uniref:peptidoglycan DD-transpeptidase MrdA n=1 Tax=Blochmannia endosymbiont of Camponotus (Colobopsis) obliquus TaxID=1505597 RepID=UPI00061A65DC|nr:peptidoglycan DD-transpeptidase MrdA [Blochmannia endosymbiont of Camponotus (Colobopsis) obliquus]AKC60475.1 penicillin-binding protein 2 [Blochmannia endosymbiont of Camponotus (Colobopsis) obliquus]